ncbi:AMP-binding protein [Vibrio sp. S9_S30]|uniref:condensation domain-containing protein n=1 Tax=Vibrio sp. S9_S30 TaxID=2720226 RepID=UPI001680F79B|nr:condensation domain-containing protein [Vibrio sp. S9_S30]MBD1557602.1 AMP-binding protein [Vibrio sp. S9_S30]
MKSIASPYELNVFIESLNEPSHMLSNSFVTFDLRGEVDQHALIESIRTAFQAENFHCQYELDNNKLYKTHTSSPVSVEFYDFTNKPDPKTEYQTVLDHYYFNKIDPSQGRLYKAGVLKLDDKSFKVITMCHQIALDGTGFTLFLDIIKNEYQRHTKANCMDCDVEMDPSCPCQYLHLAEDKKDDACKIWEQKVLSRPLSANFPALSRTTSRLTQTSILSLSSGFSNEIKSFCRENALTPHLFFKAVYALLVGRLADQNLIGVTSPMDMRGKESRQTLGCFVNTRLDVYELNESQSLQAYFDDVRSFNQAVQSFTALPYRDLINKLNETSETEVDEPTNVAFGSTMGINEQFELADGVMLTFNDELMELNTSIQLLFCDSNNSSFSFRFDYVKAQFESGIFENFLQRFEHVLRQVMVSPDKSLGCVAILLEQEHQFFKQQDKTGHSVSTASLAEHVHQWIAETPDKIALIDDVSQHSYTYQQLHRGIAAYVQYFNQFRQFSHWGKPVAIDLDSLSETVIAIVATQYLGLPYTCLDREESDERKRAIIEQLCPMTILGENSAYLDQHNKTQTWVSPMERDLTAINLPVPESFPTSTLSQFIFTSGGMDAPTGIALSHAAILSSIVHSTAIPNGERILLSTNEAFDAATLQIWTALTNGKTLVVSERRTTHYPDKLKSVIKTHQVDHLFLTTGLMERYIQSYPDDLFHGINTLVFGGDAVSVNAVSKALDTNIPNIINLYGPAETSVYATTLTCKPHHVVQKRIPIGKVSNNTCVYLVDKQGRLVPKGVTGEILIGGSGLADGYLGQPQLTTSRFIITDIPELNLQGVRVYKTGDNAYWGQDGNLYFSGRKDDEIKYKEHRFNLNDIQAAIEGIEGIASAVVKLLPQENRKVLVGYYIAHSPVTATSIKTLLENVLPSYMQPAYLVQLDTLPLTPNGKVDSKALPIPTTEFDDDLRHLSSIQRQLLSKACSVLQLTSLSIKDDFVSRGGDSISAITLSVEMESIGMKLDTIDIMKHTVFSEMSKHIKHEALTQIIRGDTVGVIDLLPTQQWFFEQNFMQPNHYNHAVTLSLPADVSRARVEHAITRLTEHHDIFRARFHNTLETGKQELIDTHEDLFSFAEESFANYEELDIYLAHLNETFDLESGVGVMFKAVLYRIRNESTVYLYLCAHHLIVDSASWRIIARDLQALYDGGCDTKLPNYSGAQIYTQSLNAQLERICQNETAYWLKSNSFTPKCSPNIQSRLETITVDEQVTAQLLSEANTPYRTIPRELLLTALTNILIERGGNTEVLMRGYGRQELASNVKVEDTIGWFTSIFPLKLPSTKTHLSQQIKNVKESFRSVPAEGSNYLHLAYQHPDGGIRRRLQSRLNASVSFKYLGQYNSLTDDPNKWNMELCNLGYIVGEKNKPQREIEVVCWILEGKLHIQFEVTSLQINLTSLISSFANEVRAIVAHCTDKETRNTLTPSDLQHVTLNQQHIETIESKLGSLSAIYPATHVQRERLYSNRVNRDVQIGQEYFKLSGTLNISAFQQAWDIALKRHDILRAVFCDAFEKGKPLVIVPESSKMPIRYEDCTGVAEQDKNAEMMQHLVIERRREIREVSSPLMRLWLGDFGNNEHGMIFTYHQVLFDQWSMQSFLAEIMRDYESLLLGREPDISPLSFEPFVHYIYDYQNDSKARAFWRNYLKGAPKNLRLPRSADSLCDKPIRMQNVNMQLTDMESRQIIARAREHSVTTNQICQLGWAHTLSKITGKKDIVFNTTLTKRPSSIPDIERMVGVFSATPPLRINVSGEVSQALYHIAETSTDRLEYGYLDLNEYDDEWVPITNWGTLFVFNNQTEHKAQQTHTKNLLSEQLGTVSGTNHQVIMSVTLGHAMSFNLFFDSTEINEEVANLIANEYLSSLLTLCRNDSLEVGSLNLIEKAF